MSKFSRTDDKIWDDIWKNEYKKAEYLIKHPPEFNYDLKRIIEKYGQKNNKIIEVGCGTGLGSLILDDTFDKNLLDLNQKALEIAKCAFKVENKKANFINGDMFEMDIQDKTYDIVFNSGVIEHFDSNQRYIALSEYKRILKDDGSIILAFPNHYSVLYRFRYIFENIIRKWKYPKEFKIYDLKDEIENNDLILVNRITTSKNMVFKYYHFLKHILLFFDRFIDFEGYLTVLIIKKRVKT
jgi:Methylase involved in ubiquinone/menaquinone biosynthesis